MICFERSNAKSLMERSIRIREDERRRSKERINLRQRNWPQEITLNKCNVEEGDVLQNAIEESS